MAANKGSAEQEQRSGTDSDSGRPEDERLLGQTLPPRIMNDMNERHLRIVYSADGGQGSSKGMQTRSPPHRLRRPPGKTADNSGGMLDRSVQSQIGRMLRDVFADVAEEPVPERFVKLLAALEEEEKRR